MKKKNDNNLLLVKSGNRKHYFTSISRVANFLNINPSSVAWAIGHRNVLKNNKDEDVTIEIVDGSDIPYKLINNN